LAKNVEFEASENKWQTPKGLHVLSESLARDAIEAYHRMQCVATWEDFVQAAEDILMYYQSLTMLLGYDRPNEFMAPILTEHKNRTSDPVKKLLTQSGLGSEHSDDGMEFDL
jgi:hypothetical protein